MFAGKQTTINRKAFTIIEAIAALLVVGFICSSVVIVVNNCVDAISNQRNRLQAIEVARENMELLASQEVLKESSQSGISEIYPDIEWRTIVEAVGFPGDGGLWLKAHCSATFYNTDNELEEVVFENWLTPLTTQQQKLVQDDRQKEQEYLSELELQRQEQEREQERDQATDDGQETPKRPPHQDGAPTPGGSDGLDLDHYLQMLQPKK